MFFTALSGFLQLLLDAVGAVLAILVSFLPGSPFSYIAMSPEIASFISKINFFVPIYEFVSILEAWLIAVSVYYIYSIWARWVKAIE